MRFLAIVHLLLGQLLLCCILLPSFVRSDPTTAPVTIVSPSTVKPTRKPRSRRSSSAPHAPHQQNSIRVQQRIASMLRLPGKKGAAYVLYPGADQDAIARIILLRAYWNFSWGLQRSVNQPSNVEYVPMQWGGPSPTTLQSHLDTYVIPLIQSGQMKRILGFNEPDQRGQANMSPDAAIALWPYLQKLGIPLCSPSCAADLSIGNNTWLETFMTQITVHNFRVDYMGVHWYGSPNINGFQSYMKAVYAKYNRPLLITEFGVADWSANANTPNRYSQAQVLSFMKAALPWMEAQSWIYGYVWFSFSPTSVNGGSSALFDLNGNLTACGMFYQSVSTENPQGNQTISVAS